MDIIRKLKILEIAGDLDDLNDHERFFLSILSKLTVQRVNENKYYLNMIINERVMTIFHIDYKYKFIRCHNGYVLYPMCKQFNIKPEQVCTIINNIIKRFNFGDITYVNAGYNREYDIV